MMKALHIVSPGRLGVTEVEVPKLQRWEVLVQTKACGICMGDVHTFSGELPRGYPVFAGHEGVGVVAEVGEGVEDLEEGDKVTTLAGRAFAEFYKTDVSRVARIPVDVGKFERWVSEPVACAVNGIRGVEVEVGDDVCVVGCGYMGLLLIQGLPKTFIHKLVALDLKDENLGLAERFGAEVTLNPGKGDVVKEVRKVLGRGVDVVIEAVGVVGAIELATQLVRPGGKLAIFGYHVKPERVPTDEWHNKGLRILNTAPSFSKNFVKDFQDAVKLMRKGVFNQELLITHVNPYTEAQEAFEAALNRPTGYIKGVLTF